MAGRHLFKRGLKADFPALNVGEPGFALDTKQLFVGATGGNVGLADVLSGGHKIQTGSGSISVAASIAANQPVTFPVAFAVGSTPNVVIGLTGGVGNTFWEWVAAINQTNTGFTVSAQCNGGATIFFAWVALGN